ncbi:MAG: sulfatase [Candidatus Sumerlaeota bacterium]|nr:sulfatase [Candidatus Sumerlaeota bacterium]
MPKQPAPRRKAWTVTAKGKRPNILIIGIDSLKGSHMSCYGYPRLTTPHMDKLAQGGTIFEDCYSPHIPTTPGYASMLTGRDCFGCEIVALRHRAGMTPKIKTLPEILRKVGYNTTCVGFRGNAASRGFSKYLQHKGGWHSWAEGRLTIAQNLNETFIPELDRLCKSKKPWMVLLRHLDPHAPYLPPAPFERMFYHGNECDPKNKSMKPVLAFKPFRDFLASWMPPGISDKDYVIAQYDGEIAYMDACLQAIFTALESLKALDNTIVVINSDHGETLYDHDCYFDHHGLYDNILKVPLIIRYPARVPAGKRVSGFCQHKDLVPTLLELARIQTNLKFEGRSLMKLVRGEVASLDSEFYITECTWMRKHGWRTPEWKLIVALEPDFHFKPMVELYNLVQDPEENHNLADKEPKVVAMLRARMEAFIAKREKEQGIENPILHPGIWHGHLEIGPSFKSSEQAYNTLHIGSAAQAERLQARQKGK